MTSYRTPSRSLRSAAIPVPQGPLRALQLIEPVGDSVPLHIVPIVQVWGAAVSADDRMAAKVKWAERAKYRVLTRDVPSKFAPYNAVIRVSASGTEDVKRDYLAQLVLDTVEDAP